MNLLLARMIKCHQSNICYNFNLCLFQSVCVPQYAFALFYSLFYLKWINFRVDAAIFVNRDFKFFAWTFKFRGFAISKILLCGIAKRHFLLEIRALQSAAMKYWWHVFISQVNKIHFWIQLFKKQSCKMYKKGYEKIKSRDNRQIVDFFNFREILLFSRLKFPKILRGQNFANRGVPKILRGQNFAKMAKIRENREN